MNSNWLLLRNSVLSNSTFRRLSEWMLEHTKKYVIKVIFFIQLCDCLFLDTENHEINYPIFKYAMRTSKKVVLVWAPNTNLRSQRPRCVYLPTYLPTQVMAVVFNFDSWIGPQYAFLGGQIGGNGTRVYPFVLKHFYIVIVPVRVFFVLLLWMCDLRTSTEN